MRVFHSFFRFKGYFGKFLGLRGYFGLLLKKKFQRVFWSFLGLGDISVIFLGLGGILVIFSGFGSILELDDL